MVSDDREPIPSDHDQTLSPKAGKELLSHGKKRTVDESERLYQLSLTPINVLERIQNDIIVLLGIHKGINGDFTDLEKKVISSIEKVVRKGECPSLLVEDRAIFRVLLCLQTYFEEEKVTIMLEEPGGGYKNVTYAVFPTLYKLATEAKKASENIKEVRGKLSGTVDSGKRDALRKKLDRKREQKEHCGLLYQKLVFTHASNLKRIKNPRTITLHGQHVSLNELLEFFQNGGPAMLRKVKEALKQS